MDFSSTEIIGYLASFIVLISFLMKDIKTLRVINSIGCVMFVAYGILLQFSMPIIITNIAIVAINIYFLMKAAKNNP